MRIRVKLQQSVFGRHKPRRAYTIGAFFGAAIAHFTGNPWIGFLCGGLAGAALAALHAWACVSMHADQTIVGTAINFLGTGIALLMSKAWFNSSDTPNLIDNKLPNMFAGMFGSGSVTDNFLKNVLRNPVSTYLVFVCVIVVWFVFYKTRFGLRLRAAGEHPKVYFSCIIKVFYILRTANLGKTNYFMVRTHSLK